MKKLLVTLLLALSFVLVLAVSVSAESLSNFINVDLTLTDGTQTVGYLKKGNTWNNGRGATYQGYDRVTIYADYTDTSKTIPWSSVKVFDGRNSEICTYDGTTVTKTGTYAQTLLGYPSGVSNVTHVYYPQGSLIIADNSFNKDKEGWNIEYLYVPKSVKEIGFSVCKGETGLTTVEFEKESALEEILGMAFSGCTSLSSINLIDTSVKKIGGTSNADAYKDAFRECTSLTAIELPETLELIGYNAFYLSGLSGTVKLPNSLKTLAPGALLSTNIETVVLGAGAIEIGSNVLGTYQSSSNAYLKNVYIPIEATFTNASEAWFACANTVNFYVIASEGEDTSAFVAALKSTGRFKFATQAEIDAGTAQSGYNAVIIEGYNKCSAFYNDIHNESIDNDCTTANHCSQCNKVMTEAISHVINTEITYLNGFDKAGSKIEGCTNESCTAVDADAVEVDPIFIANGYSTNAYKTAINGGYSVNPKALEAYEAVNGKITYGIVIANADSFDGKTLFDENKMVNSNKALQVEIGGEYVNFDCSIHFVSESSYGLKLLICAYVIDGNDIFVVQHETGTFVENTQISGGSYKSVTLATVVASLPANAWNEDN
ncbi:MAG: leucine-rich repeat domain-containing protein [Clostridia bacterium]|nr:leucine-rich repeat domain-containing protein [Clostridia bacterium]MBQ8739771.1 leucine-rich repeat domain-containing protein [Clostridia bacterium]